MIEQTIPDDLEDLKKVFFKSIKSYPRWLTKTLVRPLTALRNNLSESWVVLTSYLFITALLSQLLYLASPLHFYPFIFSSSFQSIFEAAVIAFAIHLWSASEVEESSTFLPMFKSLLIVFTVTTVYLVPFQFLMFQNLMMLALMSQLMTALKLGLTAWLFSIVFKSHSDLPQKQILVVSLLAAAFSCFVVPGAL